MATQEQQPGDPLEKGPDRDTKQDGGQPDRRVQYTVPAQML